VTTFTLQIRVAQTDGSLERILSVTRRRRYELAQLSVEATDDGASFDVELTVRSERPAQSLVRQLEKLEDVAQVNVAVTDVAAELTGARAS
jgi:acetolactate synthase regulatory subunit